MKARLRLYRNGPRDCCLLSLHDAGIPPYHVLLDCGAFLYGGIKGRDEVVADIVRATRGRIDVLVITHEDCDQIPSRTNPPPKGLRVGKVILPSGLDPEHPDARGQRRLQSRLERTLRIERLRVELSSGGTPVEVEGDLSDIVSRRLLKAVENLSTDFSFYKPGETQTLGPEGCRLHFLNGRQSVMAAAPASAFELEDAAPFDETWQIPLAGAEQMPFFQEHYWNSASWRRLDSEAANFWAGMAAVERQRTRERALPIAVELPEYGTLLFLPEAVSFAWVDTVLQKTVFCKISHHECASIAAKNLPFEKMPDLKLLLLPEASPLAYEKFGGVPVMYTNQIISRSEAGGISVRPLFYELNFEPNK